MQIGFYNHIDKTTSTDLQIIKIDLSQQIAHDEVPSTFDLLPISRVFLLSTTSSLESNIYPTINSNTFIFSPLSLSLKTTPIKERGKGNLGAIRT